MVLSQYTMACGEPEDATSLPTIDFSSEEADALMEHLGKPKIPGSILVCGPRAILSPGLETIPCLQALDSLDRILDEKTAALQLIQDQGNNLEVTKKLKKLSKALETSRHYDLVYTHVQPTTASIAGDAHTAA
jgi:hypothetical protein